MEQKSNLVNDLSGDIKNKIKEEFKKGDELADLNILRELTNDNILSLDEGQALSDSISNIQGLAKKELIRLAMEINKGIGYPTEDPSGNTINDQELETIFGQVMDDFNVSSVNELLENSVEGTQKGDLKDGVIDKEAETTITEDLKERYNDAKTWYSELVKTENSSQIREIQDGLNQFDGFNIDVNGKFSKEFFKAVIKYQTDNGLKVDGLVGRETLSDMMIGKSKDGFAETKNEARDYYNVLQDKSEKWYIKKLGIEPSDKIRSIQEKLSINETGKFGRNFFRKLQDFQRDNGLEADGLAGAKTLQKLGLINSAEKDKAKDFYR